MLHLNKFKHTRLFKIFPKDKIVNCNTFANSLITLELRFKKIVDFLLSLDI